ncbi:ATP/GTP-binding protein [Streptomyces sp. 2A115]|uniref:ATP/GTP-binding protein n=1 Tax=Streptomyces sp. 2A115 TaxID=3457439 RepID=UPI003FD04D72
MLIRRGGLIAAAVALAVLPTETAHAADPDPDVDAGGCQVQKFCVGVGVDDSTDGQGQQAGSKDTGESKVDCQLTKVDPEPPANHPAWKGADPRKSDLLFRSCTDGGQNNADGFVVGGEDQPAPDVDPQELAQRAVDSMTLLGPDIASPRAAGKYVLGLPMWMWVNDSATTYGPNTASATAGGVTVTATAKVSKIVWRMGDGATVTCNARGTPYKAEYGKQPSPDCGHRYSEPSSTRESGKFHVAATSTWTIDWQGGGQAGQLTEIRDNAVDITVAEVQVLNNN